MRKNGFGVIGILVIVVILATLAAVVVPRFWATPVAKPVVELIITPPATLVEG